MVGRILMIYKIIVGSVNIAIVFAEFSTYPSIYWNPWNPIFACDDPSINVRIGDTINFLCPSDEYKFYIPPSTDVNMIYENLYLLKDDQKKYNSCNATNTQRLLRCDDKPETAKYYTISFRDVPTSAHSIKFERGKSYYLIGTGFRSLDQLDNLVGGSCNRSGSDEQFRLRLKINVCENDECNICRSEGCYYEKCKATCSDWLHHDSSMSNGECMKVSTRECKYPYLDNVNRTEYKKESQNISLCPQPQPLPPRKVPQTGDEKCAEHTAYKVITYISVPLLLILVIAFCSIKFNLSKRVKYCIKGDGIILDAEARTNGVVVDFIEVDAKDAPGEPNLAYKDSLLSKREKQKIKSKKKDVTNADF